MHNNCLKSLSVSWSLRGNLTLASLIAVVLLLLICGQSYGQLPPEPLGFTSPAVLKLQSPKEVSSVSGSTMIKPPSTLVNAAVIIPTNHAPPVVSIEWHIPPGGPYRVADPSLTNVVLCQYICEWWVYFNLEHIGIGGKTYEIQVNFGFPDTNWWSYTRIVAPRDGVITTACPIYKEEKQRFFRVRSN